MKWWGGEEIPQCKFSIRCRARYNPACAAHAPIAKRHSCRLRFSQVCPVPENRNR